MKIHSRQASDIFRGKQRGNTEDGTGRSGACSVFFFEKKDRQGSAQFEEEKV